VLFLSGVILLKQHATVVNIDSNHHIWVSAARQSACGSCQQAKNCHQPSIFQAHSLPIKVQSGAYHLQVGDEVSIEIAEQTLWQGLAYLYLYPLLALSIGASIGQYWAGESAAIGGAALLFALALVHVKQLTKRQNDKFLPTVIKKLN